MFSNLTVSSWVGIREGCSMRYRVNGNEDVEFAISSSTESFEFVYDVEALRAFIELGSKALAELDAQVEPEHELAETTP